MDKILARNRFPALLIAFGIILSANALAHHSFAAVFDAKSPVEKSGTVTEVEWMNPHAWIYIDVEEESGGVVNWAFELGSPNGLIRRGWNRQSVQVGDSVSISGYRALFQFQQ